MKILRLLWLDLQKIGAIRLMWAFIALPALFAFNGWFTAAAFLVYAYLVPYGIFSYDDTSIAENLYGVLPVRREHLAVARYLFALVALLAMAGLMLGVNTACALLFDWPILAAEFITGLSMGFLGGLLFLCVALPMIMHMGAQKSNYYLLIIFVIIFLTLGFSGDQLHDELPVGIEGLALFCLLALLVSLQVCLRFFRKREFYDYTPMGEVRRGKKK